MATRIITKNGSGAPLASDLQQGELAVDLTNKRLYTENASGTVLELGTAPSTIDINAGTIDGTVIGGSSAAAGTFTTVTADDLSVDGGDNATHATFGGGRQLSIKSEQLSGVYDDAIYRFDINSTVGVFKFSNATGIKDLLKLDYNGDISFYEDTGTTPKFFWDASTESLGIGTTSPAAKLDVNGDILLPASEKIFGNQTSGTLHSFIEMYNVSTGNMSLATEFPTGAITFSTNGTERMRIDSSGNVGIGTTPAGTVLLDLKEPNSTDDLILGLSAGTGARAQIRSVVQGSSASSEISFSTTASSVTNERMRIDASGNLLVGTTTSLTNAAMAAGGTGFEATDSGLIRNSRNNGTVNIWNRNGTDGTLSSFFKDGVEVGSIGVGNASSYTYIGTGDTGVMFNSGGDFIQPWNPSTNGGRDNAIDLGNSGNRFDDIYATNGTIQTSDANEKQDIEELSEAEQRVAVAAKGLLRKFRWKDSVAEKGDEARIHFGIIAQDLQAAFEAEGLDAGDYAMFINSAWTDEETGEERSRMGVRYSELLAFIIAAI